jgi:uncharacterized protein YciI
MKFVIIGWDAPNSKETRPEARPDHLAHWKDWAEAGRIMVAGPMTDFAGSLFIVDAESQAEVEAKAAADPYLAKGIFTRVEVHPFRKTLPAADWD